MKLRYKILGVLVIVLAVGVLSLALAMGHTSACGPAPSPPPGATLMKGITYRCYGSPDVLRYEDIPKPTAADDEVLVKVHAASVNPLDWHYMEGTPYMVRMDAGFGKPQNPRLGVDFAGTVEAVGRNVTRASSPVTKCSAGNSARLPSTYLSTRVGPLALKPGNLTFEQAAVGADRGNYRAAGSARQGTDSRRSESSYQWRLGRRGYVRRADRQVIRRRGDRRMQHTQCRAGALNRR